MHIQITLLRYPPTVVPDSSFDLDALNNRPRLAHASATSPRLNIVSRAISRNSGYQTGQFKSQFSFHFQRFRTFSDNQLGAWGTLTSGCRSHKPSW
ncbi:Protein of unknown function [Pyronema omphalodes CBS 100304]|uniref:Uncharacterized protein n=1 Tax=Pyronema omphalodes (strain CBS 100304) TaxID=1076935 RepID=U4LW55_PYROM|nr:Protein of unknown function [Pyronema omphalodes CBS 100304]